MANRENPTNIINALKYLRDDLKKWVANNLRVKLDKNLGEENANKILSIDAEGNIITIDNTISGSVHWNDIINKPFVIVDENKHIFVDHSKVDTSVAFTSTELDATFIRLTEETFNKDELIGSTLTATLANGDKISGVISDSNIHFENNNCLILIIEGLEGLEGLPIAVFYKAGQYTVNIYGVETTVQVPKAGIYTTDYAVIELESSEIATNVTREYLDNKCLSILEISNKPTKFLHEIEFTNQWNDLFNIFAYLNPIDEETFNTWNANTEPVVVKYDNVEYICMPQALSFNGESGISVGNLAGFEGGTGNNEPFAITCGYDNASGLYFAIIGSTVDMEPTAHSVAIYLQNETYKIKDEYLENFRKEISEEIVSESNELIVVDKDGNIVMAVGELDDGSAGIETTKIIAEHANIDNIYDKDSVDAKIAETKIYVDTEDIFETDMETINALGGIAAGTNLDGLTTHQVLKKLLYPYVDATIGNPTATPNGGTYEHGVTKTITQVSISVIKKSEPITKVALYNGATLIAEKTGDAVKNGGTITFTGLNVVVPTDGNQLTVKVTYPDAEGTAKTVPKSTTAFTFVYPYYYGVCGAADEINAALVLGLTKDISGRETKTYNYTTEAQRMVIAYPKAHGVIKLVKDGNGLDNTGAFGDPIEISVTGLDGTAQPYYVYANGVTSSTAEMTFSY